MPIYEYLCPGCDLKFELRRPFDCSGDDATCPNCNMSAKRVLSAFVSLSKGSNGELASIGGSPCSTCSATSCSSCGFSGS